MALSPSQALAFVKDLHKCPLSIASMYQEEGTEAQAHTFRQL